MPEADLLVGDFAAAAFVKGVPRHGRLFVFTDHLCFHSVLFGQKTQIVIPFADVIGVEKTVENLTPGMKVRTNTKSYKFGSLYSRPKSHEMINSVWKVRKKSCRWMLNFVFASLSPCLCVRA